MDTIILFLISLSFAVPNMLVKLYHRYRYTTKATASRQHSAVQGQHYARGVLEDPSKKGNY